MYKQYKLYKILFKYMIHDVIKIALKIWYWECLRLCILDFPHEGRSHNFKTLNVSLIQGLETLKIRVFAYKLLRGIRVQAYRSLF